MTEESKPQDTGIALVTGASSGIGAATVRVLAGAGWRVVATARRSDRLEVLAAETGCVPVMLDVTDGDAVRRVGRSEQFDLIVNNAGLGRAMGAIWEASDSDVERTIDTNVTAVVNVIRAVVPGMVERGRGHIVNMSSVLALYPGPAALYGATKGAVRLLSQDLRQELRGTGVRVTEICPGRVATEFYDVALDDPNAAAAAKDSGIQDVTPDDVAQAVLYAVSAPWRVNVSTIEIVPTEQTYGGAQFTPFVG
jgi:NADP-dependent 3-hydroxy acid dehydrogenase YdfG